jgi:hypothetical protein
MKLQLCNADQKTAWASRTLNRVSLTTRAKKTFPPPPLNKKRRQHDREIQQHSSNNKLRKPNGKQKFNPLQLNKTIFPPPLK